MCEESKLKEWAATQIDRRRFGVLAGSAVMLAACQEVDGELPENAGGASELSESQVTFSTQDGTMDAFFVHPSQGKHPAVIFWPDIASIRESKRNMARRLASEGYAVLVLNPYYRNVAGEQFEDFAGWINGGAFEKVAPWREKLDADAIGRDAIAAVEWLDAQEAVDTSRGIGTQGYCMGGPFTVWSAAAVPAHHHLAPQRSDNRPRFGPRPCAGLDHNPRAPDRHRGCWPPP